MKRALAITLTVAMIGSLAFMGLAGTAAAGEYPKDKDKNGDVDPIIVDDGPTIEQTAGAAVVQGQNVNQQNVGEQTAVQEAEQDATGIDGDANVNVNVDDGDNGDSTNVEVGTTGDQTIEQSITQEQAQVNENNQIGGAEAVNVIG
ncbi:hypothetical protein [Natrarchaeobius oligotrophus]|uniref:Uncharacterized protein n=1 Tax=Natrarchaeobius chitinivorans TaxID=1679083 RepID=A0A3N6M9V1_NATCH|nr:hypothetical protein [Natrarchaeobius chitinivorans]RQH00499.1 hypothetical protein EA472_11730 [Natrarchaeobius chitinivorans]